MQTAAAPISLAKAPLARLRGGLTTLEATARGRLKGTRVAALVDRLPRAFEGEVDALLDKVGLVRKARAPRVAVEGGAAVAAAVAADVEVVAAVVVVSSEAGADVEGSADQTTGPGV